ncbi:hypothetical protein GCM10009839_43990 [Catenulispora yoronensis]|uniref:Integrase n=1 Tax=Catenulispora yoronensis TaxID=450799 RepID=A0ABP5G4U3_9ACTN
MVVCQVVLLAGSPHVEDMTTEPFERIRAERMLPGLRLNTLFAMQRATAALGFCDPPKHKTGGHSSRASGGPEAWEQWVDRRHATSTLTPRARGSIRSNLLKVGRWAADQCPEAADPAVWTRQTCAAWVTALDRMSVWDYVQRTVGFGETLGKPLQAPTKAGRISALRRFFLDAQDWEWMPRCFDPYRVLATPRSVAALLGPNPRVIADVPTLAGPTPQQIGNPAQATLLPTIEVTQKSAAPGPTSEPPWSTMNCTVRVPRRIARLLKGENYEPGRSELDAASGPRPLGPHDGRHHRSPRPTTRLASRQ